MSYSLIKSHAKINIALNVTGRLGALHKIESIISFLDIHDQIIIKKIKSKKHKLNLLEDFLKNIKSKNTVSRLLEILEKKKYLNHKFKIIVKKIFHLKQV